jgi:hypothetical protein
MIGMIGRAHRCLLAICALAVLVSSTLSAQHPAPARFATLGTPSAIPQDDIPDILIGTASSKGVARLVDGSNGAFLALGFPYGRDHSGGVRVAYGDLNGDRIPDGIVSAGPGLSGGLLRIYDGLTAAEILSARPFGAAYAGGVFVAIGDVDGDGHNDIVTSMQTGGLVRIFSLAGGGTLLGEGFPYGASFTRGVTVAVGDVNGDRRGDLITAPASGVGHVLVFDASTAAVLMDVTPYGAGFAGGVFVAAGDVNGDRRTDLITAPASGAGAVRVFSGIDSTPLVSFFAGPPTFAGGLSVAAADLDRDSLAEIIVGAGPGAPPLVGIFTGAGTLLSLFAVEEDSYTGGILVAAPVEPEMREEVCPSITVVPASVPSGVFNLPYSSIAFTQDGGAAGGTWNAAGLPAGLVVDAVAGVLSGTPTSSGVFNATVSYTTAEGCKGSIAIALSIAPTATADVYNAGLGNTQIVAAGHSSPGTPHFRFAASVLDNDAGTALAVLPLTDAPTALGGRITIAANGAFTYTPQAGDTGDDTFTYTVTSNGASAQATITLALGTQRIWYLNSAAAAGDGTSTAPFNTMAPLTAPNPTGTGDVDGPGDFIYAHSGTYASPALIEAGQTLWGAGAAFNPAPGLAVDAGVSPTFTGIIRIIGDDVTVSSLAIAGTNAGIDNFGPVDGLTIKNDVTVTSSNVAVAFTNVNSTSGGAPNFGINFRSISTENSPGAIFLENVNLESGSFTVTGDGGDTNNGSGGVMRNPQRSVWIRNSRNVSLRYLDITDTNGTTGMDSVVLDTPNGMFEMVHSNVTGASGTNLFVAMGVPTTATIAIVGSTFSGAGRNGIDAELGAAGAGEATITVRDSTFEANGLAGVRVNASTAMMVTTTLENNRFTGNRYGVAAWATQASAGASLRITGNDFQRQHDSAIAVVSPSGALASPDSVFWTRIENNTIGTLNTPDSGSELGSAIRFEVFGDARHVALVDNNRIHELANARAIDIIRRLPASSGAADADFTITNNTVSAPTATAFAPPACGVTPCPPTVFLFMADGQSGLATRLNLAISGNTAYDPGIFPMSAGFAYHLTQANGGIVRVEGSAVDAGVQIVTTNAGLPIVIDSGVTVFPGPVIAPPNP